MKYTTLTTYGFRPFTDSDAMAFAGAASGSMIKEMPHPGDSDCSAVAVASPVDGMLQIMLIGHEAAPMHNISIQLTGDAARAILPGLDAIMEAALRCAFEYELNDLGFNVG